MRNDPRTAALHARVAFEIKLKSFCSNRKVPVPYDFEGRRLTTDDFLDAAEVRLASSGTMPRALFDIQRVTMYRSGVLNPLPMLPNGSIMLGVSRRMVQCSKSAIARNPHGKDNR